MTGSGFETVLPLTVYRLNRRVTEAGGQVVPWPKEPGYGIVHRFGSRCTVAGPVQFTLTGDALQTALEAEQRYTTVGGPRTLLFCEQCMLEKLPSPPQGSGAPAPAVVSSSVSTGWPIERSAVVSNLRVAGRVLDRATVATRLRDIQPTRTLGLVNEYGAEYLGLATYHPDPVSGPKCLWARAEHRQLVDQLAAVGLVELTGVEARGVVEVRVAGPLA